MMKRISPYPSGEKAAEKRLATALRKAGKGYGFRLTRDSLWKQDGEFFIKGLGLLRRDRLGATMSARVKPMLVDELLWDILGMEDNKDEYISLRAIGAFVTPGITVGADGGFRKNFDISSEDQIETMAEDMVAHLELSSQEFLSSIGWSTKRFFELMASDNDVPHDKAKGAYHEGLYRCLALIALGDLGKAKELAESQIQADPQAIFKFGVGSKGDATLIKEYCERKLAEKGE